MTPRVGRYVAGAATGLAIALSLTACKGTGQGKASGAPAGGGVHLTAAQNVLAKVSNQTGGLTSFRGTMSMAFGLPTGRTAQMTGTMAYRLKPSRALKLALTMPNVSGGRGTNRMTEIVVGDNIYMRTPAFTAHTGKPWLGLTFSRLRKSTGVDLQSLQQSSQGDPQLNTKMLTASKDVRQVGRQTVAGVPTTHYKGTFNLTDGLAKLDAEQRAEAKKSFGEVGFDKVNFDVWVDGRQLPRRVTIASPPGAKVDMKVTMNYTAFNVPVSITAPPKSQVADGSGLLGGGRNNIPG